MAEIVYMPKLSDTMTEGVVASWNKKIGDPVEAGEILAEIETDKATMEFESFYDGFLLHIGVDTGSKAPVNSILAIIGEKDEDVKSILDGFPSNSHPMGVLGSLVSSLTAFYPKSLDPNRSKEEENQKLIYF